MNQFAKAFEKKGFIKKKPNQKRNKQRSSSPNLGWLFYKDYFKDIIFEDLKQGKESDKNFENRMRARYQDELNRLNKKDRNYKLQEHKILYKNEHTLKEKILNLTQKFNDDEKDALLYMNTNSKKLGNASFELTTTYPGLLLGSGYLHELPDIKGQAILGFDFDYTTGLPIIRGSSIKGVLRNAFAHKEYIQSLIDDNVDIAALEAEIFQNSDLFFDAIVIDFKETLLSDDYITPHKSALKDPIPLRFIKISPEVTFRFEFHLNDGIITKEKKSKLFEDIIKDFGLGAKTNVGYGKFKGAKR